MKVWYMCLLACLIVTASILDVAAQGSPRGRVRPPIAEPTDREKQTPEKIAEDVVKGAVAEATNIEKLPPEKIVASYIVAIVADANIPDDPLLIDAKKLQETEGLKMLRQYLDRELGQGTDDDKSERLSNLLLQLNKSLTPERQAKMRMELKAGKPSSLSCPWIACSLRICCYR